MSLGCSLAETATSERRGRRAGYYADGVLFLPRSASPENGAASLFKDMTMRDYCRIKNSERSTRGSLQEEEGSICERA